MPRKKTAKAGVPQVLEDTLTSVDDIDEAPNEEALTEASARPQQLVQVELGELASLMALAKQTEEARQQVLRWQADFENFRRRSAKEREDIYTFVAGDLIKKMLPVLDNFDRALAAATVDPASIISGVEMIRKQQYEILVHEGLEEIFPLGEPFDPNFHDAVLRCDADEETEDNTIVEVMQKGFMLKGRLLRPALVKVASK